MKLFSAMLMVFLLTTCAHKPKATPATFRVEYRAILIHNGQLGVGNQIARDYFVALPAGTSMLSSLVLNVEEDAPAVKANNDKLYVKTHARILKESGEILLDTAVDYVYPGGKSQGEFTSESLLEDGLAGSIGGWAGITENGKTPPAILIIVKAERLNDSAK